MREGEKGKGDDGRKGERERNGKGMGEKWRGRGEEEIEKYSLKTCSQQ